MVIFHSLWAAMASVVSLVEYGSTRAGTRELAGVSCLKNQALCRRLQSSGSRHPSYNANDKGICPWPPPFVLTTILAYFFCIGRFQRATDTLSSRPANGQNRRNSACKTASPLWCWITVCRAWMAGRSQPNCAADDRNFPVVLCSGCAEEVPAYRRTLVSSLIEKGDGPLYMHCERAPEVRKLR